MSNEIITVKKHQIVEGMNRIGKKLNSNKEVTQKVRDLNDAVYKINEHLLLRVEDSEFIDSFLIFVKKIEEKLEGVKEQSDNNEDLISVYLKIFEDNSHVITPKFSDALSVFLTRVNEMID
ncbi:MAG: hypothetical protein WCG91_00420 [Candidatus Shapirobacteria bacterium]